MKTDDPKFTAHAIGELEDLTPAERAEIEALIADDTHAAAEAAETKKLALRLRTELQDEEIPPLTAAQRARVLAARASDARVAATKVVSFPRRTAVLSFAAACVIVGLVIGVAVVLNQRHMAAVRLATESLSAAVPQEIEVPLDENTVLAEPAFSERATIQSVDAFTLAAGSSPNIDAISTTAQSSNFKVAPAQLLVKINPPALSLAKSSGSNVGGQWNLPAAMRGRMGSGSPSAEFDAARATAMWEVDKEWARPSRRFDRKAKGAGTSGVAQESNVDGGFIFDRNDEINPATTASFDTITDNPFLPVRENPLSTFSTDVDTASYAIVRRFLNEGQLPPKGAVRIEEMLNYFTYDYPQPKGDAPFSATMEVAACPWTPAHRLVRIGLRGREIAKDKRPASNLVFLLDVSGSMQPANRLPLLKQSLGLLIDQLGAEDRVAIVVYAGSSGCVLESTSDKAEMRLALSRLEAGGSTNGGSGIQLAYDIAKKNFIKGGVNRVILGTDGDWNVGITNQNDLFELITQRAKSGVFLTALGFGMGNLKDSMLVKLAGKGNGNYGYIDTLLEAKKLLVDQIGGTLVTIAKDVKIQIEFNPSQVSGYRLIGYEKRLLAKEDFNDDKKDAGEIGAGHTVTALYEVVPAGKEMPRAATVDPLKYQPTPAGEKSAISNQQSAILPELLTLKLRYKAPDGDASKLLEFPLTDTGATFEKSSRDFRFAAAVAGYGMLLRDSPYKGNATWDSVHELAVEGKGADSNGYRAEFISLLEKAQSLRR